MSVVVFEFGAYRLDEDRVTLTGPDGQIHCEPQVFRVLLHLLRNRHRAVPKEELLDVVWGDRFVSESALTSRLKAARRAVGDDGDTQHTIKTVRGLGYHFVADVVHVVDTADGATGPDTDGGRRAVTSRQLPTPRSALIGRDDDLSGVAATLRTARLTTIVGPGGVGKTSLALAVAQRLQSDYADGATFVDLTGARSADDVARILADAAGVQGDASRSIDLLAVHLSGRRILIVLDNCEHVLSSVSDVVDLILTRGAGARILATSREPLNVRGEHSWPLAPLAESAPELFVARARAADPRVEWDPDDPEIIDLCARLDGLPLALELAAGQLRRWGFAELRRQLSGELSTLARPATSADSRHGTMAAAIDWSYQLLDPGERRLLRHLSVFPSWFDVRSVERLADGLREVEMPVTLGELVDKSLVVRDPGSDRFRLLETIRAFAREHLEMEGEADTALERHRTLVLDRVHGATRLDRWLSARLAAQWRADGDDMRQAFWASLEHGQIEDAVEIAVGAAFLWRNAVGCTEGGQWVRELLRHRLAPKDHVWTLILLADLEEGMGDARQMLAAATRAMEVDDGSDAAATCIAAHYGGLMHLTHPSTALTELSRVHELAPDTQLAAMMQAFMLIPEIAAATTDDLPGRIHRLERAVSADGYDRFILHWAAWTFGLARRHADDVRWWMAQQQAFLDRTGIVETWITSFSAALTESVDGTDIRPRLARALALADREGYRAEADCALALAYSEACRGNPVDAAELIGTAIRSRFNATAHYVLYRVVVEPVVRAELDPDVYEQAVARGRGRTAAEALAARGVCCEAPA